METELLALAGALPYPATPDLAAGFWRRLQTQRKTRAPASRWSLAGVAVAAAVVAMAVIAGTVAPIRDVAADLFNRINIFRVDEDAFEGITRDVEGDDVTLTEAQVRMGHAIALPTYPTGIENSINRVVYRDFPPTPLKLVAVFYEPQDGTPFVLFATNGSGGKGLAPGATAEQVEEIPEAFWLEGLRIVSVHDEVAGRVLESQRVTEANTLIWVHGGYVYRIEGELGRDEAIKIAQSVR
jgi:hypothetical protein